MQSLKVGDDVAILPFEKSPPSDVQYIAVVAYVGTHLVELADGRNFYISNGQSLVGPESDYIVLATEEHRSVLIAKA